jgi:hypothetical protein
MEVSLVLFHILFLLYYESKDLSISQKAKNKQTPWPLVREGTIPTDRPPLVGEI